MSLFKSLKISAAQSPAEIICSSIHRPNTTEFDTCITNTRGNNVSSSNREHVPINYDDDNVRRSMKILSLFLYPIASLTCIIGNLLVIFVVIKIRRMRQSYTNFFLFNMAIADLGVGVICIIPTFIDFYEPHWLWRLGPVVCKLNYYTQLVSYTASVLILLLITIERYLAIIFPMRIRVMKSKLGYVLTVSGVWILSFTFALPNFFEYDSVGSSPSEIAFLDAMSAGANASLHLAPGPPRCARLFRVDMAAYHLATFLALYVVPLAIMSTLYGKIALVLWRSTRQLRLEVRADDSTARTAAVEAGRANGCGPEAPDVLPRHYQALLRMRKVGEGPGAEQSCEFESSEPAGSLGSAPGPGPVVADPANAAVAAQRYACRLQRSNKTLRARKRVIAMLVTVVVTFMVCKLPRHIWLFIFHHGSDTVVASASYDFTYFFPPFAYLAMYLSSAINPIIYFTFSETFRRSMHTALCLRCRSCRRHRPGLRPGAQRKSMTPAAHVLPTSRP